MIRTTAELAEVLAGTALGGAESVELAIPLCDEQALALRPPAGVGFLEAWQICRERLEETGRWPIGSVCWSAEAESWRDRMVEESFFLRHPYQGEFGASEGVSPDSVVAAASVVALDAALDRQAARAERGRSFEELLDERLATLRWRVKAVPDRERILEGHRRGEIPGLGALERWLLAWEAAHVPASWWSRFLPGARYLESPYRDALRDSAFGEPALLLLPVRNGWESLAYVHFWGAGGNLGSAAAVALLRRWSESYGAELVGHFGILLFFHVARPPKTLEEALPLAWEQEKLAECTTILSRISTCHHARMLVGRDRWSLKERP